MFKNNKNLIFNGYQAEDLGFVVVEGSNEILAQEDYELVSVEGRNGDLLINKGTYPNIEKTFTITAIDYIEDEDIDRMMTNIRKWFFDIKDDRLFYTYGNKYNIVKKVVFKEDVRTSFEEFGDFQVTFLCEPFYYTAEEPIEVVKSDTGDTTSVFMNYGDFESFPYIKIYGSGNIGFYLNGIMIGVKNVTTSVELDTKLLICLDAKGNNKMNDLLVDFPTLQRGENVITIPSDQNISKIKIIPRTIFR